MLKRSLYSLVLVIALVTMAPFFMQSASAHYDLTDPVTGLTAKYHITPDHEPIAGQSSVISFDLSEDNIQNDGYIFVITVADKTQTLDVTESQTTGNVVTTDYTFTDAGEYTISLQINSPDGRISSVQQKQSVKAAAAEETAEQNEDESSRTVVLLSSATLVLIIAILAIIVHDKPKKKKRK